MPVPGDKSTKRPFNAFNVKTGLDVAVSGYVYGIVIVDKIISDYSAKGKKRGRY
jgi:hypothetical protein